LKVKLDRNIDKNFTGDTYNLKSRFQILKVYFDKYHGRTLTKQILFLFKIGLK